jgi:hypothetical protein
MPVILTTQDEIETWTTAPSETALKLQRSLPDGTLEIVATGVEEDIAAGGIDWCDCARRTALPGRLEHR